MIDPSLPVSLGLDYGTESVRAILVDAQGNQLGLGTDDYQHGQITSHLPTTNGALPEEIAIPTDYALQHPADWLDSASAAIAMALSQSQIDVQRIVGIGVDFTSCTMLPTNSEGTPLCLLDEFASVPLAWPKLWKHHGAIDQTERINQVARQRNESFLKRYGGTIGLEWFFPKMLETLELAPEVASAADVWIEAGDWLVWQLVGGSRDSIPRSTCPAGYKAMWSARDGYPSPEFFDAVRPGFGKVVAETMPGRLLSPGQSAGTLQATVASQLGLPEGIPVSAATIDAHSAVPGVGVADEGTLVMVLGTSSCHMLNSMSDSFVPGVAGVVDGGILPGMFGYETGQAAVGDAFAWLKNLLGLDSFDTLSADAMKLPPGADGVMCLDWMNGCRTPLMDGRCRGAFTGLSLSHGPAHLYRALLEGSGFGLRWIVESMRTNQVPVDRFVATGGLPHHNRAIVQVYANVLQTDIEIHPSSQGPAVGAAVLGMVAAGEEASRFRNIQEAAAAMASVDPDQKDMVAADRTLKMTYDELYLRYRQLADQLQPK